MADPYRFQEHALEIQRILQHDFKDKNIPIEPHPSLPNARNNMLALIGVWVPFAVLISYISEITVGRSFCDLLWALAISVGLYGLGLVSSAYIVHGMDIPEPDYAAVAKTD